MTTAITPAETATAEASAIDPFSMEFLSDPLPYHEVLREAAPVVRLDAYGVYAMARYAEVHAALVDWQTFESGAGVGVANFRMEKPWRAPSLLLEADPPRHDAPRSVLTKLLSPRALRRLEEHWKTDAVAVVDEVLTRGTEFDAVTDLAEVFPLRVFPDAVGLGKTGREHLLPYGDFAFNAFGPQNELVTTAAATIGPTMDWIGVQCQRQNLTTDGIGAQIWAASDRGDITPAQAPMIVRSLLTAGVDTTVTGIAAIVNAVATHPDQWRRLKEDRSLLRVAFEEAVRLESPVQAFFRTATRDIRVGGVDIAQGEKIMMLLGAANRDPRRWENPDAFDLSRDPSGHVAFGMGLHQCVGQHIARLEALAMLEALLDRVESIELTEAPRRHLNNTLRGFEAMPVRVRMA
ncbi:cytochrome [Microbacterium sp. Root61]|uniref:cytochrome P450 n=1 Tax=Microbacterium sp. Root61 TaxID=1736570 RepID=UPI000701FB82|nr:cytochrome P450 [Microbacterium sp. Root61]KRA24512.1 cytochrome [Microbacterium sp. Root61]